MEKFTFVSETIEICTVQIGSGVNAVSLIGIYRPHSDSVANFTASLDSILCNPELSGKRAILMGDLNINLLRPSLTTETFINCMRSFHFTPLITKATRFPTNCGEEPSLLDHIWYNSLSTFNCGIVMIDITDHLPTYVTLPNLSTTNIQSKVKVTFRQSNEYCKLKFRADLDNFDWNLIKNENVNIYTKNFTSKLNELYQKSFPIKTKFISRRHAETPWMNADLKKLINDKSAYFLLFKEGLIAG